MNLLSSLKNMVLKTPSISPTQYQCERASILIQAGLAGPR
jgi:hypothetical protein